MKKNIIISLIISSSILYLLLLLIVFLSILEMDYRPDLLFTLSLGLGFSLLILFGIYFGVLISKDKFKFNLSYKFFILLEGVIIFYVSYLFFYDNSFLSKIGLILALPIYLIRIFYLIKDN